MVASAEGAGLSQTGTVALMVVFPDGLLSSLKPSADIAPETMALGVRVQPVTAGNVTWGDPPVVVVHESAVFFIQERPLQYCASTRMYSGDTEP